MELHLKCDRAPRSDLKTQINLDWGNKVFHQRFTCLKSATTKKPIRKMCQIYSKLIIKTPERCLVLLLLTLNIFCTLFYCYYCWNYLEMDLKISLPNFIFAMIYIFHKILVLIKYYVTYLKDKIFKFFQTIIDFYFFIKIFFHNI